MAVAWVLRDPRITSALIGSSNTTQIEEIVKSLEYLEFSDDEIRKISEILIS